MNIHELEPVEVTRHPGMFNQCKASLELKSSRIVVWFLALHTISILRCSMTNNSYLHSKDADKHLAAKSLLKRRKQAC